MLRRRSMNASVLRRSAISSASSPGSPTVSCPSTEAGSSVSRSKMVQLFVSGRMSKRTRLILLPYSASSHGLRDIDDATPNLRVLDRRECPDEFEALRGRQEVGHGARLTIDHGWPVRVLV